MNIQQYASILARFNHVPAVEATSQNVFLIHFDETRWDPSLVGRLQSFHKIVYQSNRSKAFVNALRVFYRTDCITSVFLSKHRNRSFQQTILMGNERILIPAENATKNCVHLCIFPFFVNNPDATLRLSKVSCSNIDGAYAYRDGVLFADPSQIPYPGGIYYDPDETPGEKADPVRENHADFQRICFITRHLDSVKDIYEDWYGKRGILFFPFQTRVTTLKLISDFFPLPTPVSDACFPNTHLKSSGSIHKKLSQDNPHWLLQDVLNTYRSANASLTNPLDNVALFVEYPFVSGFENNCGGRGGCVVVGDESRCTLLTAHASAAALDVSRPRYAAFLINGLNPKTVLQVKHPYDRYVEYQKIHLENVSKSDWMIFLYERFHSQRIPTDVRPVTIDNTIVGYKYRDAFLCLSYPMLADSPREFDEEGQGNDDGTICDPSRVVRNSLNFHTDCLLNAVERFDPRKDERLIVIGTYNYDEKYDVYQVKHRGLRNELWCLVDKRGVENIGSCGDNRTKKAKNEAGSSDSPKYFRKASAPLTPFVREWIDFYYKNIERKFLDFGNMDVLKLAMVLARHKICIKLRLSDQRRIILRGKQYEIHLDRPAIDYVNDMRLSTVTERIEKEEESCKIL